MNFAYILLPIFAGLLIGASVLVLQQVNLTGYTVSTGTPPEELKVDTESETQCPASCDDKNPCTMDWCNETSGYSCSYVVINGTSEGCRGNPALCITNTCTSGKCTSIELTRCCGNGICETNETCNSCSTDCGECPAPVTQTGIQPPATGQQTSQTSPPVTNAQNQEPNGTTSNQTDTTNQTAINETTHDHVTINEFTTRGPNGSYDEFVELYNPTNSDIDMTGWKLQYKSATGDTWQSKVGSGMSGVIISKSFFLLASKSYSLGATPDYFHTANWGISDTGGHLRIIDASGTTVDKVGWGNANEPEGSAAPISEDGKSLGRISLTTDSDDNSNDFILTTPSPKNSANQ
ncbi:MAG: lamin tail domain-containing protein [Candidatus Aenigmarchaeota archaeon]|nr:lamin tail domain-containing protein [Candidatus Aenigmarchaeota archaeon]